MELVIDLEQIFVRLVDPEGFASFQVTVASPPGANEMSHGHRLGDVVAAQHLGAMGDDGHVLVDPSVIRFLAAGEVGADWDDGFEKMIESAATKGYIDEAGRIQAHVVWPAR